MSATQVSDAGIRLIAQFEGFSATHYDDVAGNCTVGYGTLVHLGPCSADELAAPPLDPQEELASLADKIKPYADCVVTYSRPLNQNELDALTSFCYNVGQGGYRTSTVRKAVNGGGDVCAELQKYTKATNGLVYPGLVRRRQAECDLFMEDDVTQQDKDDIIAAVNAHTDMKIIQLIGWLQQQGVFKSPISPPPTS